MKAAAVLDGDTVRMTATDVARHGDAVLTFTSTSRLTPTGDAVLAAFLLPAMNHDTELVIDTPVSDRLAGSAATIQDILSMWSPKAKHVTLTAPTAPATSAGQRSFSFFSGGVDSFYTAITHPEIDTLVFVHGFDIRIDDHKLRAEASATAHRAAAALGKDLIEVVTDVNDPKNFQSHWNYYHGAAMATIAHLLAGDYNRCVIPSTYSYADLFPWGSHPLLDPLWSSETLEVIHDGANATRFEKIGRIVREPVVFDNLRVCWENRDGAFNCGRCEKCTRTMVALRAHGVLDKVTTFAQPLSLRRVRFGELNAQSQIAFTRETLRLVTRTGSDRELARALRWRLRVGPRLHKIRVLPRKLKALPARVARRLRR